MDLARAKIARELRHSSWETLREAYDVDGQLAESIFAQLEGVPYGPSQDTLRFICLQNKVRDAGPQADIQHAVEMSYWHQEAMEEAYRFVYDGQRV